MPVVTRWNCPIPGDSFPGDSSADQVEPPVEPGPALAVFTRTAARGLVKTRLIPLLGALGAAGLHAAMVADTVRKIEPLSAAIARYIFFARAPIAGLPPEFTVRRQRGSDLGVRLQHAFHVLLRQHASVVVIGTDSPLLPTRLIREAFERLRSSDAILGPSLVGGYYLIGLRRCNRRLFHNIRWSTSDTFADTQRNFSQHGYSCAVLEPCSDVDVPADVGRLVVKLRHDPPARRLAPATWKFLKSFDDGPTSLNKFCKTFEPQ
jgi:uncharacterized protein